MDVLENSTRKDEFVHSKGRRVEILEVATGLFVENGYSATSMAMVANSVGLTRATLYHHFSGKEALFTACVTEGASDQLTALETIPANSQTDPERKMRAVLEALYEIFTLSPAGRMSPLIAEVSRSVPMVARAFHDDYMAPQHEIIVRLVDEGVRHGVLRTSTERSFCTWSSAPS